MPWDTPPSRWAPTADELTRELREIVDDAAADLVRALEAGSPFVSGEFRASWDVQRTREGAIVRNRAPYAPFVEVDESGARRVLDRVDRQIATVLRRS